MPAEDRQHCWFCKGRVGRSQQGHNTADAVRGLLTDSVFAGLDLVPTGK